jgi:hypothetical protein
MCLGRWAKKSTCMYTQVLRHFFTGEIGMSSTQLRHVLVHRMPSWDGLWVFLLFGFWLVSTVVVHIRDSINSVRSCSRNLRAPPNLTDFKPEHRLVDIQFCRVLGFMLRITAASFIVNSLCLALLPLSVPSPFALRSL